MSFQAMAVAVKIDLPSSQKSLLFCIANYVNEQNKFWPSYGTLAKDSGMCRRTVITHMNHFVEIGLIDKKIQLCDKGNKSNLYTFKGVQYLKNNGYTIELSDKGYIEITPPQTNKIEGCNTITRGVQHDHWGGDRAAPNPINEPINKPINKHITLCSSNDERCLIENEAFDDLWKTWPAKKNKIKSKQAFKRAIKGKSADDINEFVNMLKNDAQARLSANVYAFGKRNLEKHIRDELYNDAIPQQPVTELKGLNKFIALSQQNVNIEKLVN